MEQQSQDSTRRFETGAVRSSDADDTRYDLITPIGLRRVAQTCAEGAVKYGERNWERGFPISSVLNHALRHINEWLAGDMTEDHLAHAAWNLLAAIHFEETRPDLIDIPTRPVSEVPVQPSFDDIQDAFDRLVVALIPEQRMIHEPDVRMLLQYLAQQSVQPANESAQADGGE